MDFPRIIDPERDRVSSLPEAEARLVEDGAEVLVQERPHDGRVRLLGLEAPCGSPLSRRHDLFDREPFFGQIDAPADAVHDAQSDGWLHSVFGVDRPISAGCLSEAIAVGHPFVEKSDRLIVDREQEYRDVDQRIRQL